VFLPLVVLGPALGRGFVLSYDMVWVPDLSLRSGELGFSSGLPRAVPSDAVVAVLDEVIPGMLLQKLVLLGALVLAGLGIDRIVVGSVTARLVAVTVYVWNPFIAERLWIGHWPLLLGYAALPWVVRAGLRYRSGHGGWPPLAGWTLLGSLSPSAGVMTAMLVLGSSLGPRRGPGCRRHTATALIIVAAANMPWLAAGLLHAGIAVTSGADVFALGREGELPPVLAALTLGGIWNAEVVPASRETAMAWVGVVVFAGLAAMGVRRWWRVTRADLGPVLVGGWVTGLGLALAPAMLPGVTADLVENVPGAGLMRDSARFLALVAPLTALVVASGAEALVERVRGAVARGALTAGLVLIPIMVLPDLAWGVGGALRPAAYPEDYARARSALAMAEQDRPGDILVLPFSSYRAPDWNGRRKVLAPLGRFLTPNDVTSDDLVIDGNVVRGEDPLGPQVRSALALDAPEARTRALLALGIQYAVDDEGPATGLESEEVFAGSDVYIVGLAGTADRRPAPGTWWLALGLGWLAWVGLILVAAATLVRRRWARHV
jgi:hypothetical protein